MTATLTAPAARPGTTARTGWLLATVLAGLFMAILDVSIVNVAVPAIRTDLGASGSGLQLIIAGYTIAYAMLLITGARLGDILGSRRAFTGGLALFTLASLACGLAGGEASLIAFRIVQGAGAALMVPQVLGVIQRSFEGAARAKALSLYSAVIAGGAVVGQVVGGVLVSADLFGTGWRPVFLVNVPLGVALLVAALKLMPAGAGNRDRRLDLAGVLTLSPAVLLLVVPLVLGHENGWPVWGWVSMAAAVPVLGLFALLQRRSAAPLVPGRLLRVPGFVPAAASIFAQTGTYAAFLLAQTLHLQGGRGFTAMMAGVAFIPGAAAFAAVSLNWRRVPARWHAAMTLGGLVVAAGSLAALGPVTGHATAWYDLALTGLGIGAGLGAAFGPMMAAALRNMPVTDAGEAAGLLAMVTQLGQVVGVATIGTLYLTLVRTHVSSEALTTTGLAMGGAALLAAVFALRARGRTR
ncbi:MFS transporter [Longispora fulva]|uniref:MFS family permease n=1 Tax=Longispora fulva TaxID=619741 RepID=A0A8J7GZC3_9ACTN|nr:MFS transporter [Longispora fulva]MBG6141181.1 MFS family permease [Longispora fulva]GIG62823.1 MFS transporter [Longispora fulva]